MTRDERGRQFDAEEARGAEATEDAIKLTEQRQRELTEQGKRELAMEAVRRERMEILISEYDDEAELEDGPDPDDYYDYLRDMQDDA